ncbi:MAG: ribosome biogenesis GTP-binding protein YihA/YsxC [Fibrobacterota bacterium]
MSVYTTFFEDANISFLTSASCVDECPVHEGIEIALMGRSNVGKSSFVNHIFEQKKLARVSKQPGKTRLLNFFDFTPRLKFVDLPGYGYARASKKDKTQWSAMMSEYCSSREQLAGILWLLDYRRKKGTAMDREAAAWLSELGIPVFVILTKRDKLNRKERKQNFTSLTKEFSFPGDMPVIPYSTMETECRNVFWERFSEWIDI